MFVSGIGGGAVLQHLVLSAHRHGGAGVDNDRAGDVRASLLDSERRRVFLVSPRYTLKLLLLYTFSPPVWYSESLHFASLSR